MAKIGEKPLEGRIALVTGASRGIGAATSITLAKLGAHVVITARTQGGLEEVEGTIRGFGGSATITPLDLTDFEKVDQLGAAIFERYKKLDIFIGNAGLLGTLGPLHHLDPKTWEQTLAVNLTSNWRLIRSLDPLLRQSSAGRAVFITSSAAKAAKPYWGGYSVSKAGLEAMVKLYSEEIKNTNIRVNLFNPGGTRTDMRAEAFPGEDPLTLKTPEGVAPQIAKMTLPSYTNNGITVTANADQSGS